MFNVKFKSLAAITLLGLAPNAFAWDLFRAPYIGIDATQTNQRYEANYGDPVLRKNPQMYGVFGGFKFSKYFGIEGGYEWQPSKAKTTNITEGQSIPGGPIVPAGFTDRVSSSFKGTLPYVGLFAEADQKFRANWFCGIKWQALVGASFTNFKGNTRVIAVDGAPFAGTLFTFDKSKTVFMAKVGATAFFTRNVGLRLAIDYRNTNTVTVPANIAPKQIELKDTWGVGLGLIWAFA